MPKTWKNLFYAFNDEFSDGYLVLSDGPIYQIEDGFGPIFPAAKSRSYPYDLTDEPLYTAEKTKFIMSDQWPDATDERWDAFWYYVDDGTVHEWADVVAKFPDFTFLTEE